MYAVEVSYMQNDEAISSKNVKALDMGDLGVLLFFVLSGTTLYISSEGRLDSVIDFYIKRFFGYGLHLQ